MTRLSSDIMPFGWLMDFFSQTMRMRRPILLHRIAYTSFILLVICTLQLSKSNAADDEKLNLNYFDTTSQHTRKPVASRPVTLKLPDYGKIQGQRYTTTTTTTTSSSTTTTTSIDFFGGIPYAAPPVGHLRWAPPEPPAPWAPATLDAAHFGPDCWQLVDPVLNPGAEMQLMSEDCLYLNVYVPKTAEPLPVMVWLHGGAFQQGGARRPEYDGRRLAERGTVVVTLNYRLGSLGFLVSSSDGLFGNFGLQDQRAALMWVKENIKYFGGDPDNITLFGESAGAVMTGLHLMMRDAGQLFHKAILQSNPLGLQFRSVVVADFIGEALKRSVDCRDLACLRAERVEEIMRAQSSLMGVPRSVGDFFTWGPTLTDELQVSFGATQRGWDTHMSPLRHDNMNPKFRNLDSYRSAGRQVSWADVNVTQPLSNLNLIPDDIPVIIGANKHEGEMFVHGAFPITMSKAVYWMFVGALFRDSASRVLKHYRGHVDQIEKAAEDLARKQMEEEEYRQFYSENKQRLDEEYAALLEMNKTASMYPQSSLKSNPDVEAVLNTWSRGGSQYYDDNNNKFTRRIDKNVPWHKKLLQPFCRNPSSPQAVARRIEQNRKKRQKEKEKALKAAAKVVVDYRPVMSRIIDDYLFRCPAWHLAHALSRNRITRGKRNNVYVYQFSHSTHIPGYRECWGKSCHTAELPYVFQAMGIIRSNYSTLGPYARQEAPIAPEYPYTAIIQAYRSAMRAVYRRNGDYDRDDQEFDASSGNSTQTRFQRLLNSFFGDYFKEDADEEIASDMADRWVEFARTGSPNYEGNKANWKPWRYVLDEGYERDDGRAWEPGDFDAIFDLDIVGDGDNETLIEGYTHWSGDPEFVLYRRRALAALGMQVVEEDVFRTMLRRTNKGNEASDRSYNSLLFGSAGKNNRDRGYHRMSRRARRQLQQIAQDMGVLGTGLEGEPRRSGYADMWEEDFFPEILELKWPPEGRLIERDCTCDMWEKIRYRY